MAVDNAPSADDPVSARRFPLVNAPELDTWRNRAAFQCSDTAQWLAERQDNRQHRQGHLRPLLVVSVMSRGGDRHTVADPDVRSDHL